MRTHPKLRGWLRWTVSAAVLAVGVVQLSAQQPPVPAPVTPAPQPTVIVPATPTTETPAADKTVAFEMRDKPWKSVLEWLSNETGLPVITTATPTGTFSFYGTPKKRYTIPDVIDVINEALLNQKFVLIRRDASFTIVPADVPIDPSILPRIRLEDLPTRGATEIVSVIVNLKSLNAEDIGPEMKKMMGPFGEYAVLTRSNQLVLQDSVKTLRRIKDTLDVMEKSEKHGQNESFSHECKYIKARDAEKILKDLLGDINALVKAASAANPQQGQGKGDGKQAQPAVQLPKIRPFYITSDERLNTVLVSGPPDKIAQARDIINKIDMPQQGQRPISVGPPALKTYAVAPGAADAMAKTLQEMYKASSSIRVSAVGSSSVMVLAPPEDHFDIARLIQGAELKANAADIIQLSNLEADKVAATLKGMFQSTDSRLGTSSGPYIEADTNRNAIIVKGTPDQVADVKLTIKAIGDGEGAASGNVRIITLDRGGSAAVAAELERLLNQMRNNPIRVVTPNSRPAEEKPAPKEPGKGGPRPPADPPVLNDPQNPKPGSGKPVTITAVGNKLIITSEDPEALKLANELARLLTSTTNEGDFEIIHLKNANATDAAKVIDEAFNGPKAPAGGNQGGGGGMNPFSMFGGGGRGALGMFGGGGATTPSTSSTGGKVRVVADPTSNSLLVKASPADMLSIRRLLKEAIDTGDENRLLTKTWVIGPLKYSKAASVADVIRDIYRDSMNSNNPAAQGGGNRNVPFFMGGGQQNQRITDASGNPRPAALTVSTEEQINSLIVHCSEGLYKDIVKLVDSLEGTAKGSPRSVKIVPIKGLDPEVLDRAIDALNGRPNMNGTSNRNMNQGGFGGGGFGGNRGGFGGGGGGGGNRGGRGNTSRFNNRAPDREPGGGGPENFERGAKEGQNPANQDGANDSILFDPAASTLQPVAHFEPQQTPPPATPAPLQQPGGEVRGPLGNFQIEALRELGVVIMSAENKEDLEAIEKIIKIIQESAKDAEIEFQLVTLKQGDATNVTSILNNLFSKVIVSSNGNVSVPLQNQQQTAAQRFTNAQGGTSVSQVDAPSSVLMIPLPRFNAILLGTPKGRTKDVLKEIERLDQPTSPLSRAFSFPLKKASAARVAAQIQAFYATRYNESDLQHQIRITSDDPSNTVFVQAAPADLAEIRDLIERIDNSVSSAINDVRIIKLRNALSDELANTLIQAISQGVAAPSTGVAPGIVPRPGGALGAPGGAARAPGAAQPGVGAPGAVTKSTTLRFYSQPGASVESGLLEDVHITSEPRSNSLIVAAPPRTMELIIALVRDLDVVSTARSEMKIFTLKKADAQATAVLLQQLFLGGAAGTTRPGGAPGTAPGLTGPTAAGSTSSGSRPLLSLTGEPAEGATLIDLKISVDDRTNSVIIAGSRNDLEVIEAVISRLEDSDIQMRRNDVYKLRNATAADVANALQQFLTQSITVLSNSQQLTAFQRMLRDVVIVPEPISNTLLISATPQYYEDLMRMIAHLDEMPPQVMIQVLIAQVSLTNNEEFGVELGLQNPVLFQRGIIPGAPTFSGQNSGIPLPTGFTVNSTLPGVASPGFNFNSTNPLQQNNFVTPSPGLVGYQGLGNLGVGRTSQFGNFGGLIFSAGSDTFSLLIRALKVQGRIDVLSRPQVMTLDNQTAAVNIGQDIPIVTNTTITGTGLAQNNIDRRNVGVLLQVTPRITPDGRVLMRVAPEVSSVLSQTVPLGNGQFGTSLNVQQIETTVSAPDGETVVIGGLITTSDNKQENKIPGLGDLPIIGTAFRFRSQQRQKQELLVILTPHIVRSQADADRIMREETRRMDWVLGDAAKIHGHPNMATVYPPKPNDCAPNPMGAPPMDPNSVPNMPMTNGPVTLPAPQMLPPGQVPQSVPYQPGQPPQPFPLPPPHANPPADQSKAKPTSSITPASHQMPAAAPAPTPPPAQLQPPQQEGASPWKESKKPAKKEEKPWVFQKDF